MRSVSQSPNVSPMPVAMRLLLAASVLGAVLVGRVDGVVQPVLLESRTPADFQKWNVWDTRPNLPGLVRRFDSSTYLGQPACTIEDISLSHDPRFASPVFEIPSDRWLGISLTVASDEPTYFFTLAVRYQVRVGGRETEGLTLPFTVHATDRWQTVTLLSPPAALAMPKAPYTHAQLWIYPVLYGDYSGQCHAWHLKAGRVHLANVKVEALPPGWQPPREDRKNWFEFQTQLLSPASKPVVSFEFLHHRPAGAKGFVRLHRDGYLVFEDGTPVRLWGVGWHEFYPGRPYRPLRGSPQERLVETNQAVKTLATLGVNFVRFHGIGRGLWDPKRGGLIDDATWNEVDQFLAILAAHGIYQQLTLWTFAEELAPALRASLPPEIRGDEGWWHTYGDSSSEYHTRKFALFCFQPMLERMLDYQERIMAHSNPYRRKRYADDPAIVIVQPINEVSLLQRSPTDRVLLWNPQAPSVRASRVLPEGVYRAFTKAWNDWLRKRFGSRERLLAEFPELAGEWRAFGVADADPAKGNVPLPPDRSTLGQKLGRDEVWWYRLFMEFAMSWEKQLYEDFARRMRNLGYRNALAGDAGGEWRGYLVTQEGLEVGYDIHHPYADGESVDDFMFAFNNPFPMQPVDWIYEAQAVGAWGKAAVISEWGAGTVNEYRAMLAILTATYGAMQQLSAIAEHTWGYPFGRKTDYLGVGPGYGNLMGDPARIGVYPVAATLFCIPEAIAPLPLTACQLFTDEDLAAPTMGLQGSENAGMFYAVPYLVHVARVRWARWDGQSGKVPDADLLYFPITSGVGNLKALPADKKLFIVVPPETLYSGWRVVKPYERVLSLYPNLRFRRGRFRLQVKLPNGYQGVRDVEGRFFERASLPKGATPIGEDRSTGVCWAFYDERSLVVADASVLQAFIPAALDTALKAWGKLPKERGLVSRWELVSATGQLRRNWKEGWVTIDSDYGQVVMGDLSKAPTTRHLIVKSQPCFGVVGLVPLERQPLPQAKRWFLVAIGRVANRDYDAVYNQPLGAFRLSGVRLKIGQGPPLCEPIPGNAALQGLGIKGCRVVALTPQLTEKNMVMATVEGDRVHIPLSNAETIWLLVERTAP